MTNSKKDGLHTITVRKGCKDGNDYVTILVDGEKEEFGFSLSRKLTGTTGETYSGILSYQHPQDIDLNFGSQKTSLFALTGSALPLSTSMSTKEYAEILKDRILKVRAWVQEQDFETEETFSI